MIHFYRYISALTVLLVVFTAYAIAVAPWFEPPPIVRAAAPGVDLPSKPVPDETMAELASLFRPGHWVFNNPKIIETEQCTLLIGDYKPVEGGNLELKPCALIFRAGGASTVAAESAQTVKRGRPIILEAPKAELAFDKPLNVARGAFGRVEKGQLAGEVRIHSPPTSPGSGDGLEITTSAVWLDRESIRTKNQVEFKYGDSSGRGSDLRIALQGGDDPDKKKSKSRLGAVQNVTLGKLEFLRLASTGRGLLGDAIPAAKTAKPAMMTPLAPAGVASENAPIEVRCNGEFNFDVVAQLARFDDQVRVDRLIPNAPPDQLRCDELLLAFAERKAQPVATPNDDPLAGRLQRLVAIGSPAVLEAPTSGMRAVAAHMEYAVADRKVILKADSRRNAPQVLLKQNDQQFTAPEVHYQMTESSRLGKLHAPGPGELRMVQGEGPQQRTITARWEKTLQIQPQDQFQVISLVQAASVTLDPLGRFDGDELHLWTEEKQQDRSLLPHRLLAVGAVKVVSQQLDVDTGRLEAWFMNLPPGEGNVRPMAPPPPIHEPVQPAAYFPQGPPQPTIRDVVRPPTVQKFHVGGEKIQLRAMVRGQLFDLEDLFIEGKADILETRTPLPAQEPIFARGASLELRHGTKPEAKVQINGQPAEVGGRGMSLAGRAIDLERGKNELRIDGLGEAMLPIRAPAARPLDTPAPGLVGMMPAAAPPVQNPAAAEKMHVVWQEGLIFDGQTARITGDVVMRTATRVAQTPVLEVTLSQRWDFQAMGAQPQPELARVFLDGGMSGVHLKNDGYDEAGQLVSREQAHVRSLLIDQLAGRLHGAGPGWVNSVRRQGVGLGAPGSGFGAQASAGQAMPDRNQGTGDSKPLTSVHVAFEKEVVGDLAKREIQFRQNVQTTYSPANDFSEVIAADKIANLDARVVLMTSEVLTVTEFLGPPRWFELRATGSTKVRGQKFDVDAPIVGYSSDKEMLTVEGDGRADAHLWMRDATGAEPLALKGQRFRYNIRTGWAGQEGVDRLQFTLPQDFKLPSSPFTGGANSRRP